MSFFLSSYIIHLEISCAGGSNRTNVKTWGFNPVLNHLSYSHNICYRSLCWSEWCRTTVVGTRIRSNTVILHSILVFFLYTQNDSNTHQTVRSRSFYPLNYGCVCSGSGTQTRNLCLERAMT